jgi:hypothetical protein
VPTFVDRGVSRGQRGGSPTVINVSFLDWTKNTNCFKTNSQLLPTKISCNVISFGDKALDMIALLYFVTPFHHWPVNVAFHGVSKSLTIIKSPGTHD